MIWSLVREQLRAQRRFVVATGVVLALAISAAAYGTFMATTTRAGEEKIDATLGYDKAWHLYSGTVVDAPPDSQDQTLAKEDAALEQAVSDGSDVIAVRDLTWFESGAASEELVAMGGTVDWDAILARGAAPLPGEAALAGTLAEQYGVDVGDTWTLHQESCAVDGCEAVSVAFTVSGIARSGFDTAGLAVYGVPGAYVAWDDSARVLHDLSTGDPDEVQYTNTTFHWNVGSTALDALGVADQYTTSAGLNAGTIAGVALALVGALVIGLIAMAFAVGRAQAQARSQWVATARTLGASRRQIAATTMLESGAVGVVAGAVGIALGFVFATAHVWLLHLTVPDPAFPSQVIAAAWAVPALVLLAIVLSAIVGAVPAFWAARVSPVAALKPVSDISEAEVSRRVSAKPLVIGWLVATAFVAAVAVVGASGPWLVFALFAAIVIVVTTPMLMHEVLRRVIPRAGARLAQSPHRARMMAGDSLLARPRQATIPAFIVALGVATLTAIVVPVAADYAFAAHNLWGDQVWIPWFSTEGTPGWMPFATVAVVMITTIVTLAIGTATATLTSREAATREALGATRRDSRLAGAIAYGVTQASGIVLGLAVGLYAAAWLIPSILSDQDASTRAAAISAAALPLLGVVVIAAIGGAIGAAVTASFTPQPVTVARLESVA